MLRGAGAGWRCAPWVSPRVSPCSAFWDNGLHVRHTGAHMGVWEEGAARGRDREKGQQNGALCSLQGGRSAFSCQL
jgi:hypothetical protein